MGYKIEGLENFDNFISLESKNKYHNKLVYNINKGIDINDNMELLFKSTYKFGYKQIMKYKNLESDTDVLLSLMSIAFMKTLDSYKVDNDNSFCLLYSINIRNEVVKEYYCYKTIDGQKERVLKGDYNNFNKFSLEGKFEDNDDEFHNIVADENVNIEKKVISNYLYTEIMKAIDKVFETKLSVSDRRSKRDRKQSSSFIANRNKTIFKKYMELRLNGEHICTDDIGEEFDISGSSVRKILKKYKGLLREELIRRDIL